MAQSVRKSVRPASGRLGVWISGIIETLQSANKQTNNESNSSNYAIDWTSTIKLSNSLMKLIAPVYPACLCAFSVCHLTIFFSETLKNKKKQKKTCLTKDNLCVNFISMSFFKQLYFSLVNQISFFPMDKQRLSVMFFYGSFMNHFMTYIFCCFPLPNQII